MVATVVGAKSEAEGRTWIPLVRAAAVVEAAAVVAVKRAAGVTLAAATGEISEVAGRAAATKEAGRIPRGGRVVMEAEALPGAVPGTAATVDELEELVVVAGPQVVVARSLSWVPAATAKGVIPVAKAAYQAKETAHLAEAAIRAAEGKIRTSAWAAEVGEEGLTAWAEVAAQMGMVAHSPHWGLAGEVEVRLADSLAVPWGTVVGWKEETEQTAGGAKRPPLVPVVRVVEVKAVA